MVESEKKAISIDRRRQLFDGRKRNMSQQFEARSREEHLLQFEAEAKPKNEKKK